MLRLGIMTKSMILHKCHDQASVPIGVKRGRRSKNGQTPKMKTNITIQL